MAKQFSITQTFLRLFVVLKGIEILGGLHETIVVTTLWSLASPNSVIAYYRYNVSNLQFTINADGRFWVFFTPLIGLLSIATLISSRRMRPEHRKWRTVSAILAPIIPIRCSIILESRIFCFVFSAVNPWVFLTSLIAWLLTVVLDTEAKV